MYSVWHSSSKTDFIGRNPLGVNSIIKENSMRYIWQVIERQTEKVPGEGRGKDTGKQVIYELPEMQCGVTTTFDESLKALSAWQGAEDDPPHRLYQIIPILEDEQNDKRPGEVWAGDHYHDPNKTCSICGDKG
jgi:hypothetical protein